MLAQKGRLDWAGGGNTQKNVFLARFARKPRPHPGELRTNFARFFLSRA